MNRLALLAPLALFSFAPLSAHALLIISPSTDPCSIISPTCLQLTGNQTGQPFVDAAIAGALGISTEVYKQNVGEASDTGSAATWYSTAFFNTSTDPKDATITWGGGAFLTNTTHLLVKDGNSEPAWYLFNITGWDGKETISLQDFWPSLGAISHVALYAGGTTTRVPEPGTMSLLGAGLFAFGFLRRRKAA
jgi:hypothetical protein